MRNQRTLDLLYHSVYGDPDTDANNLDETEDSLYHHGVLGQSWGKRHGPPYPLGGVDKKIARAEAKQKREKERRLKKLQRAAKKARKLKKKEAKNQQAIANKKQKLAKEGDMDKIRKNAGLFTNDELQYLMERDNMKRGLGGEKERTADEKFELAMKRMSQIADIAIKGGQVFGAVKQGAEMVTAFQTMKIKEMEKEQKRLGTVETEFKIRYKRDPKEAYSFLDAALGNKKYNTELDSKESKLEDKAKRALRREEAENKIQGVKDRKEQAETAKKQEREKEREAAALEKQQKQEQKEYQRGLNDLEKLFEQRKAQNKKEYLKNLGLNESVVSKPAFKITDSDTKLGRDFIQDFEFPKWYIPNIKG